MNKTNADKVIFGGDLNARDAEIKSLPAPVKILLLGVLKFEVDVGKVQRRLGEMRKRPE